MAGSGQLGLKMAQLLELPHSTVTSAIKALRAGRMLNIKGRGISAARMTADDAAAILVGIMSAAISADMPTITGTLLKMPCRVFMRQGHIFEPDVSPAQGNVRPQSHQLIDGLRGLFPDAPTRQAASAWSATAGAEELFAEGEAVSVTVGLDGHRARGFAVLEFPGADGSLNMNFYSTCEVREGRSAEEAKDLGLGLYTNAPPFVFSATVNGRVLFAIGEFLSSGTETEFESPLEK